MLTVYTDGGCINNPRGPGAWACYFLWQDQVALIGGKIPAPTTNQRAELEAATQALARLMPGCPAVLYTDSKYVEGTVNDGYSINSNTDLWARFAQAYKTSVILRHLKGHQVPAGPDDPIFGNAGVDAAVNTLLGRKIKVCYRSVVENLVKL